MVCDDGNLYSWGVGLYGILGNGTNDYALSPVLNEEFVYLRSASEESGLDFSIKKIDASSEYTAAISNDG